MIALAIRPSAPLADPSAVCSLEDWARRGGEIVNAHEESRWALAIWWEYGERHYEEAIQVAEMLGVSGNYLHKAHYVIRQVRNLPLTEGLTRIPFWTVAELCGRGIDTDDLALLVGKCLENDKPWTQEQARAIRQEYQKAKALPPVEQPKFTNGLATGAVDDGLPLAPHGVKRGGDSTDQQDGEADTQPFDVKHPLEGGPIPIGALSMENIQKAVELDREPGSDADPYSDTVPMIDDLPKEEVCQLAREMAEEFGVFRITLGLSEECLDRIDRARRYFREPEWTAAQVLEEIVRQWSNIKKDRLEKYA
jgi:hypothetical protein